MTENRKTAVYIRLSMEDENVDGRTKLESDSVTSQRILLKSFVIDQLFRALVSAFYYFLYFPSLYYLLNLLKPLVFF